MDIWEALQPFVMKVLLAAGVCALPLLIVEAVFTPLEMLLGLVSGRALVAWKAVAGLGKLLSCLSLSVFFVFQAHAHDLVRFGDGPMGWQMATFWALPGGVLAPKVYEKWIGPRLPWSGKSNGATPAPQPSGGGN